MQSAALVNSSDDGHKLLLGTGLSLLFHTVEVLLVYFIINAFPDSERELVETTQQDTIQVQNNFIS